MSLSIHVYVHIIAATVCHVVLLLLVVCRLSFVVTVLVVQTIGIALGKFTRDLS
jgi:hypothetical protein